MDNEARRIWDNFKADFWDLILLNILFVLTALPVVTYGAALAALHGAVTGLRAERGRGRAAVLFLASFRESWKRATLLWLPCLTAMGVAGFDAVLLSGADGLWKYAYGGLLLFAFLLLQVLISVGLPLCAVCPSGVRGLAAKALAVFAARPVRTVALCALRLVPLLAALLSPRVFAALFLVWAAAYFSLAELTAAFLLDRAAEL